MTNKVKQALIDAKELISTPERWTQYAWSRTADGVSAGSFTEDAVCWCSIGAIRHVTKDSPYQVTGVARVLLDQEANSLGYETAIEYNDEHTHAEVMALFDKAIVRAEG